MDILTQEEINRLLKAPPPIQEPDPATQEEIDKELDELLEKYPIPPMESPNLVDMIYACDICVEKGLIKNFEMRISYGKLEICDENGKFCDVYERKELEITPIKKMSKK